MTEKKEKCKENKVYSISRLDAINRCLYEAYRTYILGERGGGNCYTYMGSIIHEVLEGITNGINTEADLLPAMQKELEDIDMLGIEFPKGRNGEDIIREHWIQDMTHFCNTYQAPKGKNLKAEEKFIYKTPASNTLQGFIDLQHIHKDGSIDIYDYKTSSMYSGADFKDHSRQLITYVLGKEQEGYKVNSAAFIFLKYVEFRFMGKKTVKSKNETEITKIVERCKIGKEMSPYIEVDLLNHGYDQIDAEFILSEFKKYKTVDVLPEEIRDRYSMRPCVVKADLSDEARQECIEYIDNTIAMWEGLSGKVSDYPPLEFTKITKTGKITENTFFCTQLCPHYKECPYIHDFQMQKNTTDDDFDDLF